MIEKEQNRVESPTNPYDFAFGAMVNAPPSYRL